MKFRMTFKTPDAVDYAVEDALESIDKDIDPIKLDDVKDEIEASIRKVAKKFVKYDECITIEFDTKEGTATVVPV